MNTFALIILLVTLDGSARMGAQPHETLAACEAAKSTMVEQARTSGAVLYAVECVPVQSVAGA